MGIGTLSSLRRIWRRTSARLLDRRSRRATRERLPRPQESHVRRDADGDVSTIRGHHDPVPPVPRSPAQLRVLAHHAGAESEGGAGAARASDLRHDPAVCPPESGPPSRRRREPGSPRRGPGSAHGQHKGGRIAREFRVTACRAVSSVQPSLSVSHELTEGFSFPQCAVVRRSAQFCALAGTILGTGISAADRLSLFAPKPYNQGRCSNQPRTTCRRTASPPGGLDLRVRETDDSPPMGAGAMASRRCASNLEPRPERVPRPTSRV